MIKEKPQICAIDLDKNIIKAIENTNLHCYSGTLGNRIKVPNSFSNQTNILDFLHFDFPPNLHEYDIIIVNLEDKEPIEYCKPNFDDFCGNERHFLLSDFPETIFDPRPFSSYYLKSQLKECLNKEILIIVFCSSDIAIDYKIRKINSYYSPMDEIKNYSLYEFLPFFHRFSNKNYLLGRKKIGKNIKPSKLDYSLIDTLSKFIDNFIYEMIFDHPKEWDQNNKQALERKSFISLLFNDQNEIVGFLDLTKNISVLGLPQLTNQEQKKNLILELLNNSLPEIFPKIFPYSTQFAWLTDGESYLLPNHAKILQKKNEIEEEYKLKLNKIEQEIEVNHNNYKFLHDLITETGENLVKSVEYFLQWLDFKNITNMDKIFTKIKEEDLQIELENGLLIIEVKGITRTSKDEQCSQIYKIKNRRNKERNKFDVYALYIVNHERFLRPDKRKTPPFSQEQIEDAKSDERGLLTTYQLFQLYFKIEEGFITKEDARKYFLDYGLIEFKPSNSHELGSAIEIHNNNTVAILNIENITINQNSSIIICNDDKWFKAKVLEIQLNGQKVDEVSNGEIGIKLDQKITKKSILWLQQ
ncbi:hypothetical protein H6G11_11610 [Cyanobacterium aponinum FACHB-4101]|uniref:hypothetical protein n=1 Tax=Cyanobacterium aponinum TaxID=379064 RepID=UPI00167FF349|nr:hypothetical protein [Cyanobacterium aponinum]MBD2394898.1 hypothetical protein [Cyanobacterium aponinum FACHB-4101]